VFADSAYARQGVAEATRIAVEIVRKLPDQVGFAVLPRRWVVERFLAWIGRNRRLGKDFEATLGFATAFLTPPLSCSSCDASHDELESRDRLFGFTVESMNVSEVSNPVIPTPAQNDNCLCGNRLEYTRCRRKN
jgi:hypothetical protein